MKPAHSLNILFRPLYASEWRIAKFVCGYPARAGTRGQKIAQPSLPNGIGQSTQHLMCQGSCCGLCSPQNNSSPPSIVFFGSTVPARGAVQYNTNWPLSRSGVEASTNRAQALAAIAGCHSSPRGTCSLVWRTLHPFPERRRPAA